MGPLVVPHGIIPEGCWLCKLQGRSRHLDEGYCQAKWGKVLGLHPLLCPWLTCLLVVSHKPQEEMDFLSKIHPEGRKCQGTHGIPGLPGRKVGHAQPIESRKAVLGHVIRLVCEACSLWSRKGAWWGTSTTVATIQSINTIVGRL